MQELQVLDDLTREDVHRTASQLFSPDNRFSGFVLPSSDAPPRGKAFAN